MYEQFGISEKIVNLCTKSEKDVEKIFKGIISALMPIPFIIVTIAIFAYYYT